MKIWSVWLPRREGNKEGGRQWQKCNQGPSALITGINNFQSARGHPKRNGLPLVP